MSTNSDEHWDQHHVWHPYSPLPSAEPALHVTSASGVTLQVQGRGPVIDAMASWWAVVHGYGDERITAAIRDQLDSMAHVMFGGLTHDPALELTRRLAAMAPEGLDRVFLCDSGSVAVEVALKVAIQHWAGLGEAGKVRCLALRGGYHGDTLGAMSVCDPDTGMHALFGGSVPEQVFLPRPPAGTDEVPAYLEACETVMAEAAPTAAALIVEPVVQGAGGMWVYPPEALRGLARLCERHRLLLIADEIATGFGRTGRLFASEWAGVRPDVLCVGKALTGGHLTLAATLTTLEVAEAVSASPMGGLMHGPTYMGNPLACAAANASLEILDSGAWEGQVRRIEEGLRTGLAPARDLAAVADVRVLGAIGVVELHEPAPLPLVRDVGLDHGVWLRPFGRLVYTLPPYTCSDAEVRAIADAIVACARAVS